MAIFHITAVVNYAGTVEADTEDEARMLFYQDLNDYFEDTDDENLEQLEVCDECENIVNADGREGNFFECTCDEDDEDEE